MLEINNLSKSFLYKTISYPDITGKKSDLILLSGNTGSGKTTLCEMIAKFTSISNGSININVGDSTLQVEVFKNINSINIFDHIHYISQFPDHNLIGPTPIEEIELWAKYDYLIKGNKKKTVVDIKTDSDIAEILEVFLLKSYQTTPIWKLSFGKKKALAFSILSIIKRPIWILDEPFAGLDLELSKLLKKLFREHLNTGIILATSHSNTMFQYIDHKEYRLQ
jgi:ABC-type transport system involved in cytochrome c biogenesis ATPase subunit